MIDRNSEIIRLWNDNKSASEIANCVGVTRNSVIGVVTRARPIGLITRQQELSKAPRGRLGDFRKYGPRKMPRTFHIEFKTEAAEEHEEQDSSIIGVSIMELETNSCRFPTSRVDDQHYFCGKPKRDHKTSFCAEHHAVVWVKPRRTGPAHSKNERRPFSFRKIS
jgi:hypothetical protein